MPTFTKLEPRHLLPYVQMKTSRSGGSGGQHVNKVETKVTLIFPLATAGMFTGEERARIMGRLASRVQADGTIQVSSQESRSQLENRELALVKLAKLLDAAREPVKPRRPTKPTRSAIAARLDAKRKQALRKINRRKNWD